MRNLTDTEMHTVVGGDLEEELEIIRKFVTDSCREQGEGSEGEVIIEGGQGSGSISLPGGGASGGGEGRTIKITYKCGSGKSGKDDGNEDETEDSADSEE